MDLSTPKVMAILNVTPDSFYDGGRYNHREGIREQVTLFLREGADVIDVGACSTRPGAEIIDVETEITRLRLAFEIIRTLTSTVPLSVDTFRAAVAEWAVENFGVEIINDVSGGQMDQTMFATVARLPVYYVLMHMQGTPQTMQLNPQYDHVGNDILHFFVRNIQILKALGMQRIILDPGFGFGKSLAHNFDLLAYLDKFLDLGHPLMVGLSRKSMIYKTLQISPGESLNGSTVLHTLALLKGASLLRVHDVKEAKQCIQLVKSAGKS